MPKGIPSNIDIVKAMDQLLKNPRVAFSPEAVRRVRDEVVAMRALKEQVEQTIRELTEANIGFGHQVQGLRDEIVRLNAVCAEKDAQIASMQALLDNKAAELRSLASELDALIDAAALEAVARQMSSMSAVDDLSLAALGDEATDMLKRLSARDGRMA